MLRHLFTADRESPAPASVQPGDKRLRVIDWRDLAILQPLEVLYEVLIYVPWLAAALILAQFGLTALAVPCSFMAFLTCLRLSHNAQHGIVGVSRGANDWILLWLSIVMLWSNHAVKFNHLRHHRFMLEGADIEGASARASGLGAIALGLVFQPLLVVNALRYGRPSMRLWVLAELALNAAWIWLVFYVFDIAALRYHVAVMAVGHLFTAFFCVWTVHHHTNGHLYPARTQRGKWANILTYNMFLHTEHHLFPAVPTRNLHKLAKRLDRVMPQLAARQALPWQSAMR